LGTGAEKIDLTLLDFLYVAQNAHLEMKTIKVTFHALSLDSSNVEA
jgi:hypothetical protein